MIQHFFNFFLRFLCIFKWIQNFWPIRIQTQEKKSGPDPDKRTRIRNTGLYTMTLVHYFANDQAGVVCIRCNGMVCEMLGELALLPGELAILPKELAILPGELAILPGELAI